MSRLDRDVRAAARRRPRRPRHLRHGRRSGPRPFGDDSRGARARRRRRPRGRRAVLRSAGRRSRDPARQRTRARRRARRCAARSISSPRARRGRHADRPLHLRQPGPAHGSDGLRARRAADAGVDGVLILDYPVEEAGPLRAAAASTPDSIRSSCQPDDDRRADRQAGRARTRVPVRDLAAGRHRRRATARRRRRRAAGARPRACRRCRSRSASASRVPSTSREAGRVADAAVVGSALVQVIAEHGARAGLACERASEYVRWLKSEPVRADARRDAAAAGSTARRALVRLLNARAACALEIGRVKKSAGSARSTSRRARPRCSATSSRSIRARSTTAR